MPTVNQILVLAQSQVGTTEYPPNSNNVIYNTAFYGHDVQDGVPNKNSTYPWCCAFVWWVFAQFTPCLVKKTASCENLAQWFKDNGQWHASPQAGDVVFFKFNTNNRWTNHVGLVKEVIDGGVKIKTIEGNTSTSSDDNGGAVMERTRSSNIVGYGRPKYDENTPVIPNKEYTYGIDVNEAQGVIDFDKVKEAGISFCCMRSTRKSGNPDKYFERNLMECIEKRIDYSCFKYAYAKKHDEARIEADGVINLLNGRKMPIWYDLEDDTLIPLGKDGIEGITLAFIGECQEAGYECGIYCNQVWYDNYVSDYLKKKFPFWIARYGKNTGQIDERYRPVGRDIIAWQYTSKGRVEGITGDVDRDVLF